MMRHRAAAPLASLAILALLLPAPAAASISGFVRQGGTGTPIAGARVHVRAHPEGTVLSGADGSFTLTQVPEGLVEVTAAVPYDRAAAVNYIIGGTFAFDGDAGLEILLSVLPAAGNPSYTPASVNHCQSCHESIFPQWDSSAHSNAGRNPWVRDLFSGTGTPGGSAGYVFRATHDAGETGFCATCHTPMADVFKPGETFLDEVTEPVALEGVTCVSCHQMDSVDPSRINALHLLGKSTYRFPDDSAASTEDYVWGPLDDVTFLGMKASYSTLHRSSLLCASCHQYTNPDTGAPGQNTYLEWAASAFAVPGPGMRTCQDCHMPPATEEGTLCVFSPADRPADQRRQHTFLGSTPEMLRANLELTLNAQEIQPGRIRVSADVSNFGAGHSFPTGVSIRNAILLIQAMHNGQPLVQASGPVVPFWGSDDVPGEQAGDYAGWPGKGFAKILEGQINGTGPVVRPVLFIDAQTAASDTTIPSGAIDTTVVEFLLPAGTPPGVRVDVEARLLYRRAFRALQVTKGWTVSAHGGPVEIEVAHRTATINTGGIIAVPALSTAGLAVLAVVLGAAGALFIARRAQAR